MNFKALNKLSSKNHNGPWCSEMDLTAERFVCSSIRMTIIVLIVINPPTLSRWGSFTSFLPFLNLCGERLPVPLGKPKDRESLLPTFFCSISHPLPIQGVEMEILTGHWEGVRCGRGRAVGPSQAQSVQAACLIGRMHLWCVGSNHPLMHFPTPTGCSSRADCLGPNPAPY